MTETKTYSKDEIHQKILSHFSLTSIQVDYIGNEFARSMYIYCLYLFGGYMPFAISLATATSGHRENWVDIANIIEDVKKRCLKDKNYQKSVIEIESLFE